MLQERYVLLFDRTRSLSLHLFEHVHGESRDRGQAMVDLIKVYEDGGYSPTASELPDFLPLFLEFASTRRPAEAIELIGQPAHVFAALGERLRKRKSPYTAVFAALIASGARRSPMRRRSPGCWPSRIPSPTISTRSMPPGTRRKCCSVPARRRDACGKDGLSPSCAGAPPRARLESVPPVAHAPSSPTPANRHTGSMIMRDVVFHIFFVWYPYVCLTVFLFGSLIRFDREQYTWRAGSSQTPAPAAADAGARICFTSAFCFFCLGIPSAC